LTPGEIALARSVFGEAIDYARVRVRRRKWFPFQPRKIAMAPNGSIHFHPESPSYCDDFSTAGLGSQGFFIHEMTHVWQHQSGLFLPLRRHPFSRYEYRLVAGRPLTHYGIEQQAEIVRHAFLLRNGARPKGATDPAAYDALVDFPGTS
jgi:hypothetical protein